MQFGPRTFLFFVLLLAMPVVSYYLMFKPLQERIDSARADTIEKKAQLQKLAIATARTKDIPAEIEKLKKVVEFLESKLPEEKEMDKVLQEVWELAAKNQMTTKSWRDVKTTQGSNYSEQAIRINVSGPYQKGFYPFLWELERSSRLMKISDLKLEQDDKVKGNVNAEMTLTIYFEPNVKVAGAQ